MSTWRERLDDRIDRCQDCAGWRWDGVCSVCDSGAVPGELMERSAA